MFTRTNGRKSDTLDATFSYPETSKVSTARLESSGRTALITDQVEIKGTLAFDGPLELNGTFEGEIISQGTLTIGPEAVIKASSNQSSRRPHAALAATVWEGAHSNPLETDGRTEFRRKTA